MTLLQRAAAHEKSYSLKMLLVQMVLSLSLSLNLSLSLPRRVKGKVGTFLLFFFRSNSAAGWTSAKQKKTLFAISLIQWIYRSLHTLFPISSGIHAVASPHRQNGCLCWVFPALSFVLPSGVSWYRGPVSFAFPSFRTQSITFTRPVSVCLVRSALCGVGRFRYSLCMCV